MKHFYSTFRTLFGVVLLLGMFLQGQLARAQSTLFAGDIIFTAYDSTPSPGAGDSFAFVLLTPISASTTISFSDRGYTGSGWQAAGSTESTVTWTASSAIQRGTEIYISGLTASIYNPSTGVSTANGTVTMTEGSSVNGLSLANVGDQIIAFQGGGGSISSGSSTMIAGINYFYTASSTTAGWNVGSVGPNASQMPPGLTGGVSAFYTGPVGGSTLAQSGKFNCTGVPVATASAIRTQVMNQANWFLNTTSLGTYSGCTFLASGPSITSQPPNRTICTGGNTTFSITATGATSYQWQVDTGGGFVNISNGGVYSGATTATLTITGATGGMNGYQYRAVATGSGSATSNAGTLTVSNPVTSWAQTNVSCFGGNNGVAAVSVTGGVAPYSYSWSPAGGTSSVATGLSAGNYTVTVTDNLGCQVTRNYTITQPSSPVAGTVVVTNVACFGGNTGSIDLTPSGGTPGYTYNWGNGITTQDRTNLAAGNYSVTITDANGCEAVIPVTVTQPSAAVSGTAVVTNVSCFAGSNGTINLTPTGGTGPYTFNWTSGPTTEDRTGLAAGTYSVTITDANGCTGTVSGITVGQPSSPVSGTTVVTNVACFGVNTGAINLTPTGGTGPYTFSWNGGATTEDRTGLAAGTYSVTITDANGCTGTINNISVTQPASAVSGTAVVTNVSCFGGSNGTINLTPTGGTGPYTFNWTSGPTTEDRTGLAAGTYSVTITDANGCTGTVSGITVGQPSSPVSGTTVVTNVACFGVNTGAINLTPTGGTGPYTFSWNGGATTEDRTGLAAGNYSVVITDANGCTGTVNATVTQPASAVSGTTVVTNVACNGGSNGAINLTPTGGTGPYTFSWNGGATTEDRTGLAAGTYSVTITDANGCTGTINSISVTQPASAVSGTTVVTNVSCFGGSNGTINLTPTGGTGPYTFSWNGGATTEDRTGLAAGTYSVTITDANGCTGTINSISVTQPASAVSGTAVVTNVSCFGGSNGTINLTPTGGTGPYTFSWNGGATTEDRTGLAAGTYSVTITDANGCTGTINSISVTQPASAVSGTTVVTNVACNGGSNGAINLTPTGGTGPYTFVWNGGATTEDRTGLAAGNYSVVITDANGCTGTVNVTVTQAPALVASASSQTNVSCNGVSNGAATVTVTGGTPGYTYSWAPSGGTAATATGLSAGTYTVTVTDANACTATQSFTITQPTTVSGTTVVTNVACNGGNTGAINLTPTGGTAPYTFVWNGGATTEDRTGLAAGTYSVTITDANGCTGTINSISVTQPASAVSGTTVVTNVACNGGSNGAINLTPTGGTGPYTFVWNGGATTEDRTGLAAGNYSVVITDANGCTGTVNATVTQPASAVSGTTVVTNVACNGGSNGAINLTPTGGTGPYTFVWNGGATTEDRTGLAAGNYSVVITDANGCTGTVNATVTQPASAVSGTTVVTNVACNGGSNGAINLTPTGGTAPYTFVWNGGATTEDRTGLAAGNYSVVITDANGCTGTVNATVTQPASAVSGTTVVTNVACNGGSNGAINLTPTGGTGPYTFVWNGGATTEDRTGLAAGNYSVVITDANGCTGTVNATVTQPASAVSGTTVVTNVACNGGSNGAINLTPTGGTAPYTFVWNGGATTEDRTGLAAGNYSVVITDANGCTGTVNATVTQAPALVASAASQTNVACNGGANGSATVAVTGGTGSYTYSWAPSGGTAATATGLAAGTYTVTVTDANGCEATQSFTITEAPALVASAASQTNVACNGAANGSATVAVTGGTGSYTYSWAPSGGTAATATGLAAGTYTVTVTDANGCEATQSFTITEPSAIVINDQPQDDTVNTGDTATFTVNATNVTDYQWQVSTNGTDWTDITDGGSNPAYSGAETNTLTVTGVPVSFNGYEYRVILSAGTNCETTSAAATLNVTNEIEAVDDDFSATVINEGVGGVAGDVTLNDLFNGAPVVDTDITISVVNDGGMTGVTIAPDGTLNVPASAEEGSYTVTYSICEVTNGANCSTAEVTVVVGPPLGVKEFNTMSVSVYPNPASTEVFIKLSDAALHNNAKVTIFDMNGRQVMERALATDLETINISALESGVYLFNITSDKAKTTKRIIKNK